MYVCGVTSYESSHLGHAGSAVAFDILLRQQCLTIKSHEIPTRLQHLGYEVTYVRNLTDIDDKETAAQAFKNFKIPCDNISEHMGHHDFKGTSYNIST
ncbi:hypothetical protein SADUNF_Sadunf08G0100100 [Salix dunnii]|uniref:tRNA synthetases class I catalytic domain-containing protein n=1 Tax=Salix dunnii TaxID=1413687 RepID=A0A835JZZ4_9ROSI|nr:hypothetical protein SADUNF_Sadunf08G0100100 [Salix dunnii]